MVKKPVQVTLDKKRTVRFGMPNLCVLEDELGYALPQLMAELSAGKNMSFKQIARLLWAGMLQVDGEGIWKKENLTFEKVMSLMNPSKISDYIVGVGQALTDAFVDEKDDSKNESRSKTEKKPSGTSKSS